MSDVNIDASLVSVYQFDRLDTSHLVEQTLFSLMGERNYASHHRNSVFFLFIGHLTMEKSRGVPMQDFYRCADPDYC